MFIVDLFGYFEVIDNMITIFTNFFSVNPCEPNPCMNAGRCVRGDGLMYTCDCPSTHVGERCDMKGIRHHDLTHLSALGCL